MRGFNFPESRQCDNYDCGANAIGSVLAYYGIDLDESSIIKIAGTTKKSGTHVNGIKKIFKKFKLKYKEGEMNVNSLKEYIRRKVPVIITLQAWEDKKIKNWENVWDFGHYAIPVKYDKKRIYFEDPSSVFRTYISFKELEERWHDEDPKTKEKYINWGIAVFGKPIKKNKKIHMD
jgi:ABC-type bacteriocin/lantibiotic exporter with double-glycine peptidase domain